MAQYRVQTDFWTVELQVTSMELFLAISPWESTDDLHGLHSGTFLSSPGFNGHGKCCCTFHIFHLQESRKILVKDTDIGEISLDDCPELKLISPGNILQILNADVCLIGGWIPIN